MSGAALVTATVNPCPTEMRIDVAREAIHITVAPWEG
jgi:hypothetical protein